MDHNYFVYILTDKSRSTLYIGVTNDLQSRIWQHRNPERSSLTQRYHCGILVWYEHFGDIQAAIAREKQLKHWSRAKKIALIEEQNPKWEDLAADWQLSHASEERQRLEIFRLHSGRRTPGVALKMTALFFDGWRHSVRQMRTPRRPLC
jgi:putative endonuclease